ncbi:fibronectin type III domain-containing protein [Flavobacterium sp. TR2]|uniref:fibronectin type III domain-containing protein n=1 Tax=Flavobacterium sp. TR2 TaxID=2977321 RepID=UPI0021B10566|nr:fibronectin type III domain-containing protein [Flavobacterium sp. TR2]UWY27743.1 fibronectin type III domain-containing protein [Flavobacterium sp. TR2]
MKNLFHNIYFFVLFLLFNAAGYAQLYPVQLTPVFNSPYSVKISDYATSMDTKMQLLINPTDITISNRRVRLKLYIQGNGLNIQTSDYAQEQRPIYINGGELQTLTNVDIASFFRLENLQGITPAQYANPLPEGMYNFCFELYDFVTNQRISQKSCANLYLILNDPPILNTPQKNEQIAATEFPNILFTWTPRQINATNVSYKFELKQLLDPTLDPQIGFQMSPTLYEETLFGTAVLYNLSMPILTPGLRYAWRVRAISTTGLSENAIFKNDGYSEIYSFKYTASCAAPTFLLSESQSSKSVKITWEGVPEHTRYQVQYKKQGVRNAQWFSSNSLNRQSLITNLEPGVTYEFRVGSSCDPAEDGIQSFTYSNTSTFTTPTETSSVPAYNCGIVPQINIQNQKPLTNLIQSETFKAGDFPVTILELQGENSPYSGRGYIVVPYLGDTKIAVEFNSIVINTDYQLISGIVETSYNPDWKNITDTEDFAGEGEGGQIEETVPFVIKDIVINPNGDILVNGVDGEQVTIPGGKDIVITDSGVKDEKGNVIVPPKVYNVDSQGNGSNEGVTTAEGGKSTPENTDGVDKNGQATELTAKGVTIAFANNEDTNKGAISKYAFDVMPEGAAPALKKLYKQASNVALPYKAVLNGDSDTMLATVALTDAKINLDSIVFKTQSGAKIDFKRNDKVFVLTVKGNQSYAEEQVLATIKQGKKWKVIGAFMLVHISPKTVNVALVPTYDISKIKADAIISRTQAIYEKVGVKINFTKENVLKIDSVVPDDVKEIQTEKSTLTSTYSPEQQRINALYQGSAFSYVLFVTDKASSKKQQGYMRLNGQFGYVFNSADDKTPAHELGHGIFRLEHPFETYNTSESSTNLLMDYGSGTVLNHLDWKQINDPAFKLYAFQSQSSGELLNGYGLTPDFKFITAGKSNIVSTKANLVNEGILSGFRDESNVKYLWNKVKNAYTVNGEENGKKYPVEPIKTLKDNPVIWLIYNYSENCKQIKYIHTRYDQITAIIAEKDKIAAQEKLETYIRAISIITAKEDPNIYSGFLGCDNDEGGKSNNVFAINKSTFSLPDEYSVVASDENEIKDNMPIIIDNDRRGARIDNEEQDRSSSTSLLPSKKNNAEEIYKEVATLWNNYENSIYETHLAVTDFDSINRAAFAKELKKLDGKKLLMPSLIKDKTLERVSEKFLQDFFENKIKGFMNTSTGLYNLYNSENRINYGTAGATLLHHFYQKAGGDYYKMKVIADAIYKAQKGKESIDNMIKLIDQVFQHKMKEAKIELDNNKFLDKPLDNAWFSKGIAQQTFPSFESDVLLNINFQSGMPQTRIDEEVFGLLCIGGTQAAKVAVKDFKPIIDENSLGYEATVILQYLDTFGVSEGDFTKDLKEKGILNLSSFNYRGGVMAQWVLQHQYGYKPFDDYLTYIIKMKKTWKK